MNIKIVIKISQQQNIRINYPIEEIYLLVLNHDGLFLFNVTDPTQKL